MTILPATYLGSVEYFAHLERGECIIDIGEHYVKRSPRNRTHIMTANGTLPLTVHVCNANRPCVAVRDVRIDYSKRWQHQHLTALLSAYRSSPYFDHYFPLLESFYCKKYDFLADYDLELTSLLLRLAHIDRPLRVSQEYVAASAGDVDLRDKKRESTFRSPEYYQLFSDRHPFAANMSFVDLLFAEGPSSIDVLRRCRL